MKKITLLLVVIFISVAGIAATVDTVAIYSDAMHQAINCVVIKPDSYKKKKNHFPVVYLLHGYSGRYSDWIIKVPGLKELADKNAIIIVCPDGGYSSWYFDSPVDSTYKYETYVATEVVHFIDKNYRTIPDKNHRAITGLSMGGHGGLFLGLRHADIFGAAGSMSGGVDLSESRNRFEIIKRIGDTTINAKNWHDYSVVNLVENYANTPLKIIVDCGVDDFFINGNRLLHKKMTALKIQHDYIERPGEHNWAYWENAIRFQLYFFKEFFEK
ncbi:alpha/beta hydrolase [Ferruginibacter sp. SUN106]|uniref:alpha/beta hydrolase n=1 Tax=Ferruginibacter sp. SUN106 TaxID=2978348 RepID=UPI003D36629E